MRVSATLALAAAGMTLGFVLVQRASFGRGEFWFEYQARAHCPSDTVVWVNTGTGVCHFTGVSSHGNTYYRWTRLGVYMCEGNAKTAGYRPALDERHP